MKITPKTQALIDAPIPKGERHKAKTDIAMSLIGDGNARHEVIALLHTKFPAATASEIEKVVDWAISKNPTPSVDTPSHPDYRPPHQKYHKPEAPAEIIPPEEAVKAILSGPVKTLTSPVEISNEPLAQLIQVFNTLFNPEDYISIVTKFTLAQTAHGPKANPIGAGANKLRDEWIEYFKAHGVPQSDAGAWMRPNPVQKEGSGKGGAVMNADPVSHRFLQVESDSISKSDQLAIFAELGLPIAAIISSGGKSWHAWLRIDAINSEEYEFKATRILAALGTLGFDKANKNSSRLSRLPTAKRVIGATGTGIQDLYYLAPEAKGITETEIRNLEFRVRPAKYRNVPMRDAIYAAFDLYEEIYNNKSKTGLRTGFPRFDAITGGLKPGWLTIVCGETNSGKTSFVLNMVINALLAGQGVVLFSFEMEIQEIIDILFAHRARINRNHFNNGYFTETDLKALPETGKDMMDYPLYVFDDPRMTPADMDEACQRIGLTNPVNLIVVDYMQLAAIENPRDNREQQVAATSRACKSLAKRFKAPVLGVSQLNDEGAMRESRSIAHDANCVIKLQEDACGGVIAQVVKGRSIPKGDYFFEFEREFCIFKEVGCDERIEAMIPKPPQPLPDPTLF